MNVMDALIFIFIFCSVAFGFFLGRRTNSFQPPQSNWSSAHNRYIEGLKYLLDEQPDDAIDALVSELEISQQTLEMYFSLGALWRKKGEMERAIRVHHALLESPTLTALQRQQAQLELALDYTHSGVLDRGEVLLKELAGGAHPTIQQSAGRELVLLFQEEREWEKAIVAVDELCRKADIPDLPFWRHVQAHYCCELAERVLGSPDWNEPDVLSTGILDPANNAQPWIAKAEHQAPEHARVLFIKALLALGRKDLAGARHILRTIKLEEQHSMLLVPLMLSIGGQYPRDVWDDLLSFYRDSGNIAVLPFLSDLVYRQYGEAKALDFLVLELRENQNYRAIASLLVAMDTSSVQYSKLRPALIELMPFQFSCHQCGFQGRQFYWCCPSCKAWR